MVDPLVSAVPATGTDHALPVRFSAPSALPGTAELPQPRRSRRVMLSWMLALAVAAVLGGGFAALQLTAAHGFDEARTSLQRAASTQDAAALQVRTALTASDSTTTIVEAVLSAQDGGLIDAGDRTTLTSAQDRAVRDSKTATSLLPATSASTTSRPFWFWETNAAADRLNHRAADARKSSEALKTTRDTLDESTRAVQTSASAALIAAADRAGDAEAANVPATNGSVLALRGMVTQVKTLASPLQERMSTAFPALVLAVQRVQDSHAATLSAESGPLADSRQQLEVFARSLAPGVLMDFEWADLVNGLGGPNNYLSGETAWGYDQGGYATIRLSNSIAEDWPSDATHALVAHEVGHAITVRCRTMYDTSNAQTTEAWATAWAISMGFTDDANGTSAYGAPPADLIATAAGCR